MAESTTTVNFRVKRANGFAIDQIQREYPTTCCTACVFDPEGNNEAVHHT